MSQDNQEVVQDTTTHTVAATPADHNPLVDYVDLKFTFREDKMGDKRAPIEVKVPVPSIEGIAEIYNQGGKGTDALKSLVVNAIQDHIRGLLNEDATITSENFPFEKATWDSFVNTPESERKGRGIAKEVWEGFVADYVAQMPAVTGKKTEQVEYAAKLLFQKFQPVKTDKDVISLLKNYLSIYLNQTPNAEQFTECVKFLVEKADTLLAAEDKVLTDYL